SLHILLILTLHILCVNLIPSLSFFFHATATTEIYTLSLHDALPIFKSLDPAIIAVKCATTPINQPIRVLETIKKTSHKEEGIGGDRKSTRLNSSHVKISYAVFCLKKKNKKKDRKKIYDKKRLFSY